MKIVSLVFHPLLMATYLNAILLIRTPLFAARIRPEIIPQFLLVILLITAVMPAFSVFLLKTFKYISNLDLTTRKERIVPFIFILVYYAIATYLFMVKLEMGFLFIVIITSATFLIFILLIITLRFKISIHATSIWACVGLLTGIFITHSIVMGGLYYGALIAAGLTSTSRLYLGYHTPSEVWTGSIVGFSYSLIIMLVLF